MRKAWLASTIFAGAGLVATPAFAQEPLEAQPPLAETGDQGTIVITGSRIARPNLEQSSPVAVVDAQEISYLQPTSAEDFLRQLPGTTPGIGPQTNNGSDGSARVDLRGLGDNRNLVLLNERRITPRGTNGVVDLNVIPVALIERVDVFTGGASTVYGADAVAGVVNFITRRDFAGIDINASYGITERTDGETMRVDLTIGANFDDGRGNAVLSAGYTKTDPVLQGHRAISTFARQSSNCTASQIANDGCDPAFHNVVQGFPQGSPVAAPATITSPIFPETSGLAVDPSGNLLVVGVNDYNFNPLNLFQTPLERWSVFGQAHYEISPAVEVYMEGMFVRTNVEINLAPAGVFGSVVNVPLNSPFLSAQQAMTLCEASVASTASNQLPAGTDCAAAIAAGQPIPTGIGRRFVEAGPRRSIEVTNMFHVTAGARGPLTSTLNWDIYANYGRSDRTQERIGWGLLSRVREGVAGCPAGSSNTCVPFNLFGGIGSITPEMLASIDLPTYFFASTEFGSTQAVVSGDIGWASPLAVEPVGIALGVEYRRYEASSAGDAISRVPGEVLGAGAAGLPIVGEYNTKEAFAELVIPLVEDRPFFHNLTLEAGARYSDYSTSGGNWTWKVGGSWTPVRDIKFRGVYSRAVRAPNIAELFQPVVIALTARTTDPCQGSIADINTRAAANGGDGATWQQLCLNQLALVGAPAGLLGNILQPAAGQIQSTQGGNPDLDPEKARSITAGVVVQPRWVPGLALTFDYWDILVTDAISAPSASDIIDGCFVARVDDLCSIIFRNPADGRLSGPAETTFGPILATTNSGRLETNGFDFGASYRRDLGLARLNISATATYTKEFLFQATPGSINRRCLGYYSPSCGQPNPFVGSEWVWNVRTTLSFAQTDVSLLWRHLSAIEVEPDAPVPQVFDGIPTTSGPGVSSIVEAYRRIPAYDYFDLAIQHHIADNLRITMVVQNLFDKDPPDVGNTIAGPAANSGNTFPSTYDTLGRRYTVGVNLRF